jgi:hypothetical protein
LVPENLNERTLFSSLGSEDFIALSANRVVLRSAVHTAIIAPYQYDPDRQELTSQIVGENMDIGVFRKNIGRMQIEVISNHMVIFDLSCIPRLPAFQLPGKL